MSQALIKLSAESSFGSQLTGWYDPTRRDLPWRKSADPYAVWIAEVMLQQTVVAFVVKRFDRWMKRFPTISELASAQLEEVLSEWEGLGYYGRARRISETAKILSEKYGSAFPDRFEEIRSLPGIGDYTASAIASIAFELPFPPVDTNVRRIVGRYLGAGNESAWESNRIKNFLTPAWQRSNPATLTQAIMELGQTVCLPRNPVCHLCPLGTNCKAFADGRTDSLPPKSKPGVIRKSAVALFLFVNRKILLQQSSSGLFEGLWLLPVVSRDEISNRIVASEEPIRFEAVKLGKTIRHSFTNNSVVLNPFQAEAQLEYEPLLPGSKWHSLEQVGSLPMPSAHRKLLNLWLGSKFLDLKQYFSSRNP